MMEQIADTAQWDELLASSETADVIIFKHSNACGISEYAYSKLDEADKAGKFPVPVHMVIIQEHRSLSGRIAEDLSLTHQSPQVIVIRNREVLYHASHYSIEPADIIDYLVSE